MIKKTTNKNSKESKERVIDVQDMFQNDQSDKQQKQKEHSSDTTQKASRLAQYKERYQSSLRNISHKFSTFCADTLHKLSAVATDTKNFLIGDISERRSTAPIKESLREHTKKPIKFTITIITVVAVVFIIWGSFAPLDSATIAPGFIIPHSKPKIIQHLEGGIIEKIHVREGDTVHKGDTLIVLQDVNAKTDFTAILSNLRISLAIEGRLLAENNDQDKILFSHPILNHADPEVEDLIHNQEKLLKTKNAAFREMTNVYKKRIESKYNAIDSTNHILSAYENQLKTTEKQLNNAKKLFEDGLITQPMLSDVQNRYDELLGRVGSTAASVDQLQSEIYSFESEMLSRIEEHKMNIHEEYKRNHGIMLEYMERYERSKDVLERTNIVSPINGVITSIAFHTIGGIIPPHSNKILEILPIDDELVVEVQISPKDIDHVAVGMKAKIQLEAYKQRLVPRVNGEVIYVSADKITDQMGHIPPHYIARIKLDDDAINKINFDIVLQSGMPVAAFIVSGTRTFLQYMASPIVDSFHRAFKEA